MEEHVVKVGCLVLEDVYHVLSLEIADLWISKAAAWWWWWWWWW